MSENEAVTNARARIREILRTADREIGKIADELKAAGVHAPELNELVDVVDVHLAEARDLVEPAGWLEAPLDVDEQPTA